MPCVPGRGQQPRGAPQRRPGRGAAGESAVGEPRGTVVGGGGFPDDPAAQRRGRRVQRVGRSPCGVCRAVPVPGGGQVPDLPGCVRGGAGSMLPDRCPLVPGQPCTGRASAKAGVNVFPALAELGQRQIRGQLPAAVPDRLARLRRICGRATEYPVTWPGLRVLNLRRTSYPRLLQPAEELILARRCCGGGAHRPLEGDPRGLRLSAPLCFLCLRASRSAGRGPVSRRGPAQSEPVLDGEAGFPHPVVVVRHARPPPVLAGQRRHDMDMVGGVPDSHPADRLIVLSARGQTGPVHDPGGHLGPLLVRQQPVPRCGACHAMPHRPVRRPVPERGDRLLQQPVQRPEIPARHRAASAAPARPGHATRRRCAGRCAPRSYRARTGSR